MGFTPLSPAEEEGALAPAGATASPGLEGGFSPLSPANEKGALAPAGATASPGLEGGFSPLSPANEKAALTPAGATVSPGLEGGFSPLSPPNEKAASAPAGATALPGLEGGFSPLSPANEKGALASGKAPTQTRLPAREVFLKRAAILRSIRHFFDTRGYLEVETPMLHTVAGGAAARPFSTHHNALDIPLSLRIAPELYLKRLVVGGLDRVYEINRNFRNEGVSTQHNPEFTMLEFYQAYANYHELMDLTPELIATVAQEVNGTTVTHFDGHEIDLSKWQRLSMREAIRSHWPAFYGPAPSDDDFHVPDALKALLARAIEANWAIVQAAGTAIKEGAELAKVGSILEGANHILQMTPEMKESFSRNSYLRGIYDAFANGGSQGKAIADLFELLSEPHLIQPTIIYDFPLAVSPLSKVKPDEPDWVERFEFYIGGFEVGNAFSELNDPADQLARFEAQVADKDPESMAAVDEDYVRALGYGLPPTAGEGIGIDRLTMILTGSRSIRDVILFPLMRPPKPTPDQELSEPHGESSE